MFFVKVSNTIFKSKSSSSIQASNKGRWFISSFSFKLMDMAIFRASFNNQWPLDWFKMQTLTTWDKMSITIYDIMGNMANDPRTNMHCNKTHGFSKLKDFLKHDHFACKLTQFTFLVRRQHFEVRKFKTIKGEKNENE